MKVKIPIYIDSNGDGSYSVMVFESLAQAESVYEFDIENGGEAPCDAAEYLEFELDENGQPVLEGRALKHYVKMLLKQGNSSEIGEPYPCPECGAKVFLFRNKTLMQQSMWLSEHDAFRCQYAKKEKAVK